MLNLQQLTDTLRSLVSAPTVLGQNDKDVAVKVSQGVWQYIVFKAKNMLDRTGEQPLAFPSSSDATPLITKTHLAFQVGGAAKVRKQGQVTELLLEKGTHPRDS